MTGVSTCLSPTVFGKRLFGRTLLRVSHPPQAKQQHLSDARKSQHNIYPHRQIRKALSPAQQCILGTVQCRVDVPSLRTWQQLRALSRKSTALKNKCLSMLFSSTALESASVAFPDKFITGGLKRTRRFSLHMASVQFSCPLGFIPLNGRGRL